MSLAQLIEGYTLLTKKKFFPIPEDVKDLGEERAAICIECPVLYKGFCTPGKKIPHSKTGELVGGCGCFMAAKVLCETCECPAGKW